MKTSLMKEAAIHCDETYAQIVQEKNHKKSYVWVMTTAEYRDKKPVIHLEYVLNECRGIHKDEIISKETV